MSRISLIVYSIFSFLILSCTGEKVIIDVDAGADDAIAMLLLLRAESDEALLSPFEIIAITCTYGNVKEEIVETNVLKTLAIANRSDLPVYAGAKKPLLGHFSSDSVFGKDGFGDAEFTQEITGNIDRSKHASIALVELTKKYEGNISIVILGPTTNVALAASLDNDFPKRVKRFYVMGSSVAGIGLYKPNVEFNFGADPESNYILLNASTSSSHLTIFPWETATKANYSIDWRKNIFGKYRSSYVDFLNAIESVVLSKNDVLYTPADAMTVAVMLRPEIVKTTLDTSIQAVTDGAARGSVLVEYRPKKFWERPENARIVQEIDVQEFQRLMIDLFCCERIKC